MGLCFTTDLAEDATDAHNAGNISASVAGVTGDNVQAILTNLFQFADNGKTDWATVVGAPLTKTDTYAQLKSKTQTIKNTLASNLSAKGQPSTGAEPLTALANKVGQIETGKKVAKVKVTAKSNASGYSSNMTTSAVISGLDFLPKEIIVYHESPIFYGTGGNQAIFVRGMVSYDGTKYTNIRGTLRYAVDMILSDVTFTLGGATFKLRIAWDFADINPLYDYTGEYDCILIG